MHRLTILAVGKIKSAWIRQGCDEYAGRLDRDWQLVVREIPPSKRRDEAGQREEESAAVLRALTTIEGEVWVLDERGRESSSRELAQECARLRSRGTPLTLVIGGAFGVDDGVRARGTKLLALSRLTLPHELCRLLLLEQLYRATEILKGTGYHHS